MRIKTQKNDKVISFNFSADILKNCFLEKIIRLYGFDIVYLNVYALKINNEKEFVSQLKDLKIDKYWINKSFNNIHEIAIMINCNSISTLMDTLITYDFEELTIWNCYTNWEAYIKKMQEVAPMFTFSRMELPRESLSFYLNYNIYQGKTVEIIYDLDLNKDISKNDLFKILDY